MGSTPELDDRDYVMLADFRYELRRFLAFSEREAGACGLTPQQHQALLAIRGAPAGSVTIGYLAQRLLLKPHSASGLVDRLEVLGLLQRAPAAEDRRQAILRLTPRADELLARLSCVHRTELARMRPVLAPLLEALAAT
ncbi:MAG: MarR family transcriptional regulator [Sphingomonadales bacterium]|nr:MarR family transcriptional regulator [Sphingomonadales bacterium]